MTDLFDATPEGRARAALVAAGYKPIQVGVRECLERPGDRAWIWPHMYAAELERLAEPPGLFDARQEATEP